MFYTRVLEMLGVAADTPRDPDLSHDKNSVNLCNNTSRHCYTLVDDLVNSSNFKDLFRTDLDIFPASLICFNKTGKKTLPSEEKLLVRKWILYEIRICFLLVLNSLFGFWTKGKKSQLGHFSEYFYLHCTWS